MHWHNWIVINFDSILKHNVFELRSVICGVGGMYFLSYSGSSGLGIEPKTTDPLFQEPGVFFPLVAMRRNIVFMSTVVAWVTSCVVRTPAFRARYFDPRYIKLEILKHAFHFPFKRRITELVACLFSVYLDRCEQR